MEQLWRPWREMARESKMAARFLKMEGCYRSCASRLYYSAYQFMTALSLYATNLAVPDERQAWSHEATPQLVEEQLGRVVASRDTRKEIASKLRVLYKLRISADYLADRTIDLSVVEKAEKECGRLMKIVEKIFPRDETDRLGNNNEP